MLNIRWFIRTILDYLKPKMGQASKIGNYYSTGSIWYYKRGGCVLVVIRGINLSALSTRTAVANIPAGFRPVGETYGMTNSGTNGEYFLVQSNGDVQFNAISAKTIYASTTYTQWN